MLFATFWSMATRAGWARWWRTAALVVVAVTNLPTVQPAHEKGERVPAVLRLSDDKLQGMPYCVNPRFFDTFANSTADADADADGPTYACGAALTQHQTKQSSTQPLCPRWVHFPKCGTSFRRVVLPWFQHKGPKLPDNCDRGRRNARGQHIPYLNHEANKAVGVFRDPTQRLISAFHDGMRIETNFGSNWNKSRMVPMKVRINKQSSERDKILEYAREPGLLGCQTKMVLGMFCNDPVTLTRAHIEEAKRRVWEDFAFVGILEFYPQTICLFHQQFGGVVSWTPEFGNDRPGRESKQKDTRGMYSSISFPTTLDPFDEEVYAVARKKFFRNLANFYRCPVTVSSCTKERARRKLLPGSISDWEC